MNLYNFKNISVVPSSTEFCDIILSKTQRKTPTVIHKHFKITRIRSFYMRKVKITQQNFYEWLSKIIQEFPKIDSIHPFYSSLLDIYYDKDHYKLALGQVNLSKNIIHKVGKEYSSLIKFGDSLYRCKQLKKIALGKMVTLIKKQKNNLEYLEQVRQHLSRLPSINPYVRTLIICGFPNVGKSSFLNKLTRANVDVQPYPFTTKSLYVGHMDYKYLRWQLIDTPGILDQKLEDRNVIEMQAITALAYLRSAVLFFIDISECCGHSVDEQINLFRNISVLFANKPTVIVCNKIDLLEDDELDEKFHYIVSTITENFIDFCNLTVLKISTLNHIGIQNVQEIACDSLLTYRVENKLRTINSDNLKNKLYIAYPNFVDNKVHTVCTSRVDVENDKKRKQIKTKRKLERDIELEMGEDYILDLKKNYKIPDKYKYDIIPEIWEGHNIADFIQPDLMDKLKILEKEEKEREDSGFYCVPKIEKSEEMKTIKEIAEKICQQKIINRLESRTKKQCNKPKLSRISTQFVKLRNFKKFENEMEKLGVAVNKNVINKFKRKINSNKTNNTAELETTVKQVVKNNWLYNKKRKKTICESDRFIGVKLPKHLYSGKRGVGKTNRR